MATYVVQEQEYTVRGEKCTTKCKRVKFYPNVNKKTQKVESFGSFHFPVLKVVLLCIENGDEHTITWSKAQPQLFPNGKFKWHQPAKMVYQQLRVGAGKTRNKPWDSRRTVDDTLSPMKRQKGMEIELTTPEAFAEWLVQKVGENVAEEVITLFANKIAELASADNLAAVPA